MPPGRIAQAALGVPMLIDGGWSLPQAAQVQSLMGITLLIGRLGSGFLVDHIFAPFVAAGIVLCAALDVLGVTLLGIGAAASCALLVGLALGTEGDVVSYLTVRYFGLGGYGRRYGFLYGAFALGIGASPVIMSRLLTLSGTYQLAL